MRDRPTYAIRKRTGGEQELQPPFQAIKLLVYGTQPANAGAQFGGQARAQTLEQVRTNQLPSFDHKATPPMATHHLDDRSEVLRYLSEQAE